MERNRKPEAGSRPPNPNFRLAPGKIECDGTGLRVGGVALLARNAKGFWASRDEGDLGRDLSRVYGLPVNVASKRAGLATIANALQGGEIARAQIAALFLQLPDPTPIPNGAFSKLDRERLAGELAACGLLKTDDDWDEQHPRTGAPPNPGWFATKPKDSEADEPPAIAPNSDDGERVDNSEARTELVADNSEFHDTIRDKLVEDLNKAGNVCFSEFTLNFKGLDSRLEILCRSRSGVLKGIEVKTGETDYMPNQKVVYPHTILGAGVTSNDPRITSFGFAPGQILPAFDIDLVYASGLGAEYEVLSLRELMLLGLY